MAIFIPSRRYNAVYTRWVENPEDANVTVRLNGVEYLVRLVNVYLVRNDDDSWDVHHATVSATNRNKFNKKWRGAYYAHDESEFEKPVGYVERVKREALAFVTKDTEERGV